MKKENYCKYDLEELEELIEESYSYYSFLDSKNPDNLTMRFNELCSNIEVSAKLEKLKKLCFAYGYVEGLKKRSSKKTPSFLKVFFYFISNFT